MRGLSMLVSHRFLGMLVSHRFLGMLVSHRFLGMLVSHRFLGMFTLYSLPPAGTLHLREPWRIEIHDYVTIIRGLGRDKQFHVPPEALELPMSTVAFMNDPRTRHAIATCRVLDLSGMRLTRLPVHVMQRMAALEVLKIKDNPGLEISQDDVNTIIMHNRISEVVCSQSAMDISTLMNILKLPELVKLDISGNRGLFGATRPTTRSCFRRLSLVELNVSGCDINERWLRDIFQCRTIVRLAISCDPAIFKDTAPTWYWGFKRLAPTLHDLDVSGCSLNEKWLEDIFHCTKLARLNISYNTEAFEYRASGQGPVETGRPIRACGFRGLADTLLALNVSHCNLTDAWLEDILHCTKLQILDISNNQDLGKDTATLSGFEGMKSLVWLNAKYLSLSPDGLKAVCRCGGLQVLDVSGCAADEGDFGSLDILDFGPLEHTLVRLRVRCMGLGPAALGGICKLRRLEVLDISSNDLLGPAISTRGFSFGRLEGTLTELYAADIKLRSSGLKAIGKLVKLSVLRISGNPLDWSAVRSTTHAFIPLWRGLRSRFGFGQLAGTLRKLDVSNTSLSIKALDAICEFGQLEFLNISSNRSIGRRLTHRFSFGNLRYTLRELGIARTGLTIRGLGVVCSQFMELGLLDVRYNDQITPESLASVDFGKLSRTLMELRLQGVHSKNRVCKLKKKLPETYIW